MRLLNKNLILAIFATLAIFISIVGLASSASAAGCASLPTDKGTASSSFNVSAAGTYRLWAHIYAPTATANTVELGIDSTCLLTSIGDSGASAAAFTWVGSSQGAVNPIEVNLTAGSHTLTLAGQDSSVGVDRIILETNGSCTPTGDGSNCTPKGANVTIQSPTGTTQTPLTTGQSKTQPSGGTATSIKHQKKSSSILKVTVYAVIFAAIVGIICLALIYYASKPNNLLKKLPFFKDKKPTYNNPEEQPTVVVMPGAQRAAMPLQHKKALLMFSLGFSVLCGLLAAFALAAPDNVIVIDLTGAKTTGQAQLVASTSSINGHMIQFGTGGQTAAATPSGSSTKTSSGSGSGSSGGSSGGGGTTVASSNCTNPSWSSSDPEDTDPIGNDDVWWVNNDAWSGSHGPQSIFVCNQSSWYATSNQPNIGGQVETYPDTEYDIAGRGNATKTIAQYNSITSSFSENYPAAGSWDAAYDLWLNNWSTEIMIWNQWTGTQTYWPSDKSITVNLSGVNYWFQNLGGEYIFFRQNQVTSGSVDILAAFRYLVSQSLVKSSDVPTQLEYGVEVCSTTGTETFPMTGLSFNLN